MANRKIDLNEVLERIGPGIAERSAEREAKDTFVADSYSELRQERVFSGLVPEEYGGGGASHAEMCDFLRRLAHRCPSTALALSMHQHLVAAAVANDKAGRPGRKLLDKVAEGEAILVSTGANDWLSSNGSADAVDGGFLVTAVKPFASGSPAGDILVTSAAHDGKDRPEVLHFPVPLSADGVRGLDDWEALGMRATGSQTIRLERVFVPEEAVALRRPRGPFHPAFAVILTVATPLIMSVYLGVAESAARIARGIARKRLEDPVTPILIGRVENALTAARLAVEDMARVADGYDFAPDAELASHTLVRKSLASNAVQETVDAAMAVAGGGGFMRKAGLERLFRDAQGVQFHPLPEARQLLFTGRLSLDLDPVDVPQKVVERRAA